MSYSVSNPTEQPIIMSAFEGQTYYIEPGASLEVESERAALTLVDYGARLSSIDRVAAIEVEGDRTPDERERIVAERSGEDKGATELVDLGLDPAQLKGKALDAALKSAGLPVTGTADEKRTALAAHLHPVEPVVIDERTGEKLEQVATDDGEESTEQTGSPATPGGAIVEGATAAGDVGPFDEQNAPVVLPAVDVDEAPAR